MPANRKNPHQRPSPEVQSLDCRYGKIGNFRRPLPRCANQSERKEHGLRARFAPARATVGVLRDFGGLIWQLLILEPDRRGRPLRSGPSAVNKPCKGSTPIRFIQLPDGASSF